MRLSTIRIKNYRSLSDATIKLSDYNCFVGANGAGKSSVLSALNIFFRDSSNSTDTASLSIEDFHQRRVDEPIEITVTFTHLSDEAKSDLKDYVRQNELTITARATWDEERRSASVKQFGSRMVIREFAPFFEAVDGGKKVAELVPIYEGLRERVADLQKIKTKAGMQEALRSYEEAHPELCKPVESSDEFYGWSKGANRLAKHIQWVYIPAVKDATEEEVQGRSSALGQLLDRTVRAQVDFDRPLAEMKSSLEDQYAKMLETNRSALSDVSTRIQDRLRQWSHPGASVEVNWSYDADRSIVINAPAARITMGEGPFQGELARLGHGLQRSFIVALLTEVAAARFDGEPMLLLGFEEPELYQHPPQARHLAGVLQQISEGPAQVLVTTHSPYFVSGQRFESIRMTRKDPATGVSQITQLTPDDLSKRLAEALGEEPTPASAVMAAVEQIMQPSQNELFFSGLPVLVEGLEDVAFVTTALELDGRWSEFRRHGGHFVVCGGKRNMSRPLAIAEGLGIKCYVMFDADYNDAGKNEAQNRRDNGCLLSLAGYGELDPWPTTTTHRDRLSMFSRTLQKEIQSEISDEVWGKAKEAAMKAMGVVGNLSPKNVLSIAATLEVLRADGVAIPVLTTVCANILAYGSALGAIA